MRNQKRAGFTLVEVLAALLMVAIVLPLAMKGVTIASATASAARHRSEASTLAQSKLDELVALQSMRTTQGVGSATAMSGDFGNDWPGYQWSAAYVNWSPNGMNMNNGLGGNDQNGANSANAASTTNVTTSSANNTLQELDVHVTWTSRNQQQTLTLSTLVYQSGNISSSSGTTGGTTGQ